MQITTNPSVEARGWLRGNPNPSAFATNRFGTTARALAFVEELYAMGAVEVLVERPGVDAGGDPYADTLIVRCDWSHPARGAVERFCEAEGPGDVPPGDFVLRSRDRDLTLWWD